MNRDDSIRCAKRLFREAAWAPFGVLAAHTGTVAVLGHLGDLDLLMHFLGGLAGAFFLHRACQLCEALVGNPSQLAVFLLVFGLTCSVALFWEFGEFLSDRYLGTATQGSVGETLGDLLLGVTGAGAYLGGAIFTSTRRSRSRPPGKTESPRG